MRFEVPQFIEIEDKIFGPLTWRQFVYVGGGAGIAAVLFFTAPFIVFVLIGVPIGALSFLLGFYPVNNRPFSIFLEAMMRYFKDSRLYLWRKTGTGVYSGNEEGVRGSASYTPPTDASRLHSLSRQLETKTMTRQN